MTHHRSRLPDGISPRLLSREQAAGYVAQSVETFNHLVKRKELPGPIEFSRGHARWDRKRLDDWLDDRSGLGTPVDRDTADLDRQFGLGRHSR
jgi:predicted DNA-binding transcriptional regulator AlpA